MPVFEAVSTVVGFFQLMALDHGAHGPIYDEDAFIQQITNAFHVQIIKVKN
jgi:hypothetical protein